MLIPAILVAAVAVSALLYVARPFFGDAAPNAGARADVFARRRLALVEERDRALAALKELEFDHRTGKVSDADYREEIGALRRRAVETLRVLEPREKPLRPARSRRPERQAGMGVGR
jgi:hypothetical protein